MIDLIINILCLILILTAIIYVPILVYKLIKEIKNSK